MTQGEKVGRGDAVEAIADVMRRSGLGGDDLKYHAQDILAAIREGKVPGVRLAPSVGPDPRDQWYPGADGVQTVQELWAYYCERGDQMAEVADLREHLAQSERECMEQARLNGMGSEREARLMAEVAELRAKVGDLEGAKESMRLDALNYCKSENGMRAKLAAAEADRDYWRNSFDGERAAKRTLVKMLESDISELQSKLATAERDEALGLLRDIHAWLTAAKMSTWQYHENGHFAEDKAKVIMRLEGLVGRGGG